MTKPQHDGEPWTAPGGPLDAEATLRIDDFTEEGAPLLPGPWENEEPETSPYALVESGVVKSNKPSNEIDAARLRVTELRAAQDARLRDIVQDQVGDIWRLLRRLGVPAADLDDYTMDVLWVLARKIAAVEVGSERAFLYQTALHIASRARRTVRRRREVSEQDDDNDICDRADPRPLPDEIAARRQRRDLLDQVLDLMAVELKTVFVLFELEEVPSAEIARLLSIPVGTVKSRLKRAREQFSERLSQLTSPRRSNE